MFGPGDLKEDVPVDTAPTRPPLHIILQLLLKPLGDGIVGENDPASIHFTGGDERS